MAQRSKKPKYDSSREYEMLNSPVRMDGVGEDQVVKDLLSDKFVKGSDIEAGQIALALAELLTGMKASAEQQNAIMKRFEKLERAQEAWETDKQKFLEEVDKRASSLIVTTQAAKDKMAVEWMQAAKEAKEQAVAEAAVGKLMFEKQLAEEPKETIISQGIMEIHRDGETLIPLLMPEIVAIKDKKWVLPPGQAIEVPHTVAVRFREMQQQKEVLKKRQDLMKDGVNEATKVADEWNKINKDYKLGGETMIAPLA